MEASGMQRVCPTSWVELALRDAVVRAALVPLPGYARVVAGQSREQARG